MNENVRGVPVTYTHQPVVLPGRRVETPVMRIEPPAEEYSRGRATPSNAYPVAGGYGVSPQVDPNRFSDPVRRYSHSHRPSGYLIPRSQSLRALHNTAELPINDMKNAPAKPPEPDIVYYGYPDSNLEGNVPPSNAQFAKGPKGPFKESDEKQAPLLSSKHKDPRYVLEDDFVKKEDSVSSTKIFKLRELLRMQQKMMLALFGILVLIIIALIIVVAILVLNDSSGA